MTVEHKVEPKDIEPELKRIWDSLEGTNKMRACLFNLIFYTEKEGRDVYVKKLAHDVIQRFPSRILFITHNKKTHDSYLKTKVSVMNASEGNIDIACDMIEVDVAGDHLQRIPYLVLPHLVPDLPVFLVWAENPTEMPELAKELEKLSTRVIFDSETTKHLPTYAHDVLQHYRSSQCEVADLNWARIEEFRDLIASTFNSDERLEELKRASEIKIHYNNSESKFFLHTKTQAIYLQGWLACQLKWKLNHFHVENEHFYYSYDNGKELKVTLEPVKHTHLPAGMIIDLFIQSDQTSYSFKRNLKSSNQINMVIYTKDTCDIPSQYISPKSDSSPSLVKEICHKGTSKHYIKLLTYLTQMEAQ